MSMKLDHKSALKLKLNLVPKAGDPQSSIISLKVTASDCMLWSFFTGRLYQFTQGFVFTRRCHRKVPMKSVKTCIRLFQKVLFRDVTHHDQIEMSCDANAFNSDEVCSRHVCLHFVKQCNSSILCQNYWNKKKKIWWITGVMEVCMKENMRSKAKLSN